MLYSLFRAHRAQALVVNAVSAIARLSDSVRRFASQSACTAPVLEPLENRQMMSTYYVSASGNDSNKGTSTASAWKSISKVNSVDLNPGDSVLFQGGQTFYGSLNISSRDAGSSSSPVTFGSFNGQATINSGGGNGATVTNASGVWFENLKFVGSPTSGLQAGITFQGWSSNSYITNDRVDHCDVSGYYSAGILMMAAYTNGGINGIRITNNNVHDNVDTGIKSASVYPTGIINAYVGYNTVYNNYGDGHSQATGNGIELGGVSGAMVEYNVAYLNGSRGGIGGVGIWAFNADKVTFQYNESYNNRTTHNNDGDGFDFDADVSNSVMQYNYAFGNDGTGAQLDQWKNDSVFTNDIVRYNVFQNNGRKNNYGNLEVWGKVLNSYLYNNVIYTTPGNSGSNSAIRVHNNTISGLYVDNVHFVDNIIDTTGGAMLLNIPSAETQGAKGLTFTGNVYWTNGASVNMVYGNTDAHSLATFQSLGQESWSGKKYGIFADPKFVNSNSGTAIPAASLSGLAAAAAGYKLQSTSPALSQSLSVTSMYGITTGGSDYYGDSIASNAATVAGADQSRGASPANMVASASTVSASTTSTVTSSSTTSTSASTTATVSTTNVSSLSGYDIGSVSMKGANSASNGTFTVTASGSDIWGTSDAFRFDETTLSGNGTIVARLDSMTDANAWAKAGVMIRTGLASNASEVSMLLSPSHNSSFQSRSAAGASTSNKIVYNASAAWVKLVRSGNTFTGYISSNGVNWTETGSTTVDMGSNVLVGLAVTSHNTGAKETAVFSDVSIT